MCFDQRAFIMSKSFDDAWRKLGLNDEYLLDLCGNLCKNPKSGDEIPGSGGLRKIRVMLPGRGKRGGARVVYVDFAVIDTIYFFYVYAKNEKDNLTKTEIKELHDLIKALEKELVEGKGV